MSDEISSSPATAGEGSGVRVFPNEPISVLAAAPSPPAPSPASGRGEKRERIVAAARGWIGTPYVHQAAAKGQGTDCLGLIRGLYAELYGAEPEAPPPYTPDWNEARASEEPLLSAARRHLKKGPHTSRCARRPLPAGEGEGAVTSPAGRGRAEGAGEGLILPAQILIFRILPAGPAKHCGVAVSEDHFVHAYAGRAVIESWLSRWWIERLAGVFEFPGVEGW